MMSDSENNIKFEYLYRDGANYKIYGFQVFSNPAKLTIKEIEVPLRSALISGEFFDPQYWNIPRLKFDDWNPEKDHSWNEFESISYTDESPTIEKSISEFLKVIEKAPKY